MDESNRLSEEEAIFRRFRPICAALAEKPSPEILSKLEAELNADGAPRSELSRIQAYIIFPLQLYLRSPILPENYTIKVRYPAFSVLVVVFITKLLPLCYRQVLEFIRKFYEVTDVTLTSEHILLDLLNNILALMTSKSDSEVKSVDLRVAALRVLQTLIRKSEPKTLANLFDEKQKLLMSHLIFSCLDWIDKEKRAKSLLEESVKTILMVAESGTNSGGHILELFQAMFLQMLPGTRSHLYSFFLSRMFHPNFQACRPGS